MMSALSGYYGIRGRGSNQTTSVSEMMDPALNLRSLSHPLNVAQGMSLGFMPNSWGFGGHGGTGMHSMQDQTDEQDDPQMQELMRQKISPWIQKPQQQFQPSQAQMNALGLDLRQKKQPNLFAS